MPRGGNDLCSIAQGGRHAASRFLRAAGSVMVPATTRAGQPHAGTHCARLESAGEEEDQHDHENDTQPAARAVSPASAMRPRRQRSDQHQHRENNQNRDHGNLLVEQFPTPRYPIAVARPVHKRTDARIDRNYDDLTVAKGNIMLSTVVAALVVLWLLGITTSYTLGGFIHILLVIAIIVVLLRVVQGRSPLGG
jgi:hypothetical protein